MSDHSRVPDARWKAVVEATVSSQRCDCGHPRTSWANRPVYLRTERAGGQIEVWSVCIDCKTDEDYIHIPGTSQPPSRTRYETL